MDKYDEAAVKKMEALLDTVAEAENFDAADDELSVEELDTVTGGVKVPNFKKFMEYVRVRDTIERAKHLVKQNEKDN